MRRWARTTAMLVAASLGCGLVVGAAGCAGGGKPSAWADPDAAKTAGASTPAVCGRIRTAIAGDMKPIGSALGAMVGYASAGDESGRATAQEHVAQAIKDMGADIAKAAADASDSKLKTAVATSVSNINAVASDAAALSAISDVSGTPAVSSRLDDATHPIAVACG